MKWTKFSFSNTYHMGRWRCYMCLVFVCNTNALLLLMTAKANKINIHDVTGINDSHNEMHLFSLSVLVSHVWSMLKILHGVHTTIFYGMVYHIELLIHYELFKKKSKRKRNSWITNTFPHKCLIQLKCWHHYCQSINLKLKLIIFRLNEAHTMN